jgi:hypothetical protein
MFGMSAATAAVVGAGAATIGSALINSHAVSDAADQQAQGTANALAENAREFDITQANQAPWLTAGKNALAQFATENDKPLDTSTIQMDPGYQFGLKQGMQALDRQTAAAGGRISGAALKAAAQYGTDYATTGYSAAYARANQARTDRLNRLAALADIGQTATQNVGALGARTASANSALMESAGNNAGAATLARGNIWGNTGNQIMALYGRTRTNGFMPNADGIGANPYEGYDAAAAGGWGIE